MTVHGVLVDDIEKTMCPIASIGCSSWMVILKYRILSNISPHMFSMFNYAIFCLVGRAQTHLNCVPCTAS